MEPIQVHCPACFAKVGEQCTQPDATGRHPVRTFHLARVEQARWLPTADEPLQDVQGDIWEKGEDGLMHSFETAPFTLEHVEKKWGPLTGVPPEDLAKYQAKKRRAR